MYNSVPEGGGGTIERIDVLLSPTIEDFSDCGSPASTPVTPQQEIPAVRTKALTKCLYKFFLGLRNKFTI
jgi:hypothetical protein